MNNFYNQYEEPYNPQEYYPNTYNLWQNSRYYDINNLSPQNCASQVWANPEPCGSKEEVPVEPAAQNGGVISRVSLYQEPVRFYGDTDQLSTQGTQKLYPADHGWTRHYWHKEGEPIQGSSRKQNVHRFAKMQKRLKAALAQPVKLDKAESMMQKMGWQGGALGKTGEGIVEPIAPNAAYATQNIGFGQQQAQPKRNTNVFENKEHFSTNVLMRILEFVKNEAAIEMVFDSTLWKAERKRVHGLVHDLINGENDIDFSSIEQLDLVQKIHNNNCYVLSTLSEGNPPNRQLCIYKEAPPHVYLITPDDLRDDDDLDPKDKGQENGDDDQNDATDMDVDESNPFLKSITRNLKQENISKLDPNKTDNNIDIKKTDNNIDANKTDRTILDSIVEYFKEFSEQNEFTEFRFLGPFSGDEIELVNEFLSELYKCMNMTENDSEKCRPDLLKIFETGPHFGFYEDVNGSTVIYKVKKEEQPQPLKH